MTGERGSAEQYTIAGHMTKLVTAFVLRQRFGSHCACFLIEGLVERGVPGAIRGLGKGLLSDADTRLLVRICAALTTRDSFESWKRTLEPDWDEKENHEKFREFAVASLLDLLRPGSVFWKGPSPNRDDMQCVSRIISIFARASEKAKLQAFRAFLENEISLDQMRKILGGESLSDRKDALLLVKANQKLKPKEFYEKLHGPLKGFGIHLSANPDSYRKQIEIRSSTQSQPNVVSALARGV